jgi:hypothetical protein
MHVRAALLTLAFIAGTEHAAAGATFAEAARLLDGEWRGAALVLKIDAERAQASMTPDRPFEWERFVIKDIRDNEVVFSIGAELFEATVAADTLTLTSTSFRGSRVLFRDTGLRGSASD